MRPGPCYRQCLREKALLLSEMTNEIAGASSTGKGVASSVSTGGGGPLFENRIQALHVLAMMSETALVPGLSDYRITKLQFQGRDNRKGMGGPH